MTNKSINILEDVLSMKMWNFFIEQDSLEIQDLVCVYDLYNICFLSNLKGFELPQYQPISIVFSPNKPSILNLFSSKLEISSISTVISIGIDFEHDICTLQDDNGKPYEYEYIQPHFRNQKKGRHKNFNYNGYLYSSLFQLTNKMMEKDLKHMATFFAQELSQIDIKKLENTHNFNHYSKSSPFKRYGFSISFDSIFSQKKRDSGKMNSLEKSELILEVLQYNNSPLAFFIEKYLMLSQLPQNKTVTKVFKF